MKVLWTKGWQCLDGEKQADVEDISKAELLGCGDGLDTKHRREAMISPWQMAVIVIRLFLVF